MNEASKRKDLSDGSAIMKFMIDKSKYTEVINRKWILTLNEALAEYNICAETWSAVYKRKCVWGKLDYIRKDFTIKLLNIKKFNDIFSGFKAIIPWTYIPNGRKTEFDVWKYFMDKNKDDDFLDKCNHTNPLILSEIQQVSTTTSQEESNLANDIANLERLVSLDSLIWTSSIDDYNSVSFNPSYINTIDYNSISLNPSYINTIGTTNADGVIRYTLDNGTY